MSDIEGVGPDSLEVSNEQGGRQSYLPYRMDLMPARAALDIAKTLKSGAEKYGEDNWHRITTREHLNHLLVHVTAWLAGDRSDKHLCHAACRGLMALEIALREEQGADDESK